MRDRDDTGAGGADPAVSVVTGGLLLPTRSNVGAATSFGEAQVRLAFSEQGIHEAIAATREMRCLRAVIVPKPGPVDCASLLKAATRPR